MPTNPFFRYSQPQANQIDLMQDLTDHAIQMAGVDVYYLPRILLQEDQFLGESAQCLYREHISIEMLLQSVQGWEGDQDIISKFGIEIKDSATFVVSRRRFLQELANFVTKEDVSIPEQQPMVSPREGDLIYVPMFQSLFEIKFVEKDKPFFQFGSRYSYELKIERYINSHAFFDTGIPEIDRINEIRLENNEGNDISKDPNEDNTIIQMEQDGNQDKAFTNKTVANTNADGTVNDINRGTGIINFNERSAIEAQLDNYLKGQD